MLLFYFHILESNQIIDDEEGLEFSDLPAAKSYARKACREMIAASAKEGTIRLDSEIIIQSARDGSTARVSFQDAVDIVYPAHMSPPSAGLPDPSINGNGIADQHRPYRHF